jgi:heme/copper-type cytochrome/quinol oxidase subunit 2
MELAKENVEQSYWFTFAALMVLMVELVIFAIYLTVRCCCKKRASEDDQRPPYPGYGAF